jgi:hypothetical protein
MCLEGPHLTSALLQQVHCRVRLRIGMKRFFTETALAVSARGTFDNGLRSHSWYDSRVVGPKDCWSRQHAGGFQLSCVVMHGACPCRQIYDAEQQEYACQPLVHGVRCRKHTVRKPFKLAPGLSVHGVTPSAWPWPWRGVAFLGGS